MEKRDRDEGVSRCRADWAPTESPDSPHHPRRYTRTEIIREIIDWIKYLAIAVVVGLLLTTCLNFRMRLKFGKAIIHR